MPFRLAQAGGALADAGLAIEWTDYATGTGAMLADLAAGRLDAANLLTEGAALGLARGLPLVAVSLFTTSPLIWGVHVSPESSLADFADLAGRRFAISREGSGSHLMSLALAIDQGWPIAGQTFVTVDDLPGAIAALGAGRADVFLWEHFTTEPAVAAGAFRRIGDFVSPWPAWVLCANAGVFAREGHRVTALLEVVAAEAARLQASDDRVARIAARYGLAESAVAEWLDATHWVGVPTPPDDALAAARRMLEAAGAVGS